MNLRDLTEDMKKIGYEPDDAEARVCQDIVLKWLQGTARGSRVQNREIESKNMQTTILHKSCKMRYNMIDIAPE